MLLRATSVLLILTHCNVVHSEYKAYPPEVCPLGSQKHSFLGSGLECVHEAERPLLADIMGTSESDVLIDVLLTAQGFVEDAVLASYKPLGIAAGILGAFVKCDKPDVGEAIIKEVREGFQKIQDQITHEFEDLKDFIKTALSESIYRANANTVMMTVYNHMVRTMKNSTTDVRKNDFYNAMEEHLKLENALSTMQSEGEILIQAAVKQSDGKMVNRIAHMVISHIKQAFDIRQYYYALKCGLVAHPAEMEIMGEHLARFRTVLKDAEKYLDRDVLNRAQEIAKRELQSDLSPRDVCENIIRQLDEQLFWRNWHVFVSLRGEPFARSFATDKNFAVSMGVESDRYAVLIVPDSERERQLFEMNNLFQELKSVFYEKPSLEAVIEMGKHAAQHGEEHGIWTFYFTVTYYDGGQLSGQHIYDVSHRKSKKAKEVEDRVIAYDCGSPLCGPKMNIRLFFVS